MNPSECLTCVVGFEACDKFGDTNKSYLEQIAEILLQSATNLTHKMLYAPRESLRKFFMEKTQIGINMDTDTNGKQLIHFAIQKTMAR